MGNYSGIIIYLVAIVAMFYFLLIKPQKKKEKEHRDLISSLKKGDEILTTSGFICKIVSISKNGVYTVKLGESKVKMYDWAINSVIKENANGEVLSEENAEAISESAEQNEEINNSEE